MFLYLLAQVNGQFDADMYLQLYWPDISICNVSDPTICKFDPNNNWNPSLQFANIRGSVKAFSTNPFSIIAAPLSLMSRLGPGIDFSGW